MGSLIDATGALERHCRSCGHLLRGAAGRRCPECGREFDPDDPRTTSAHAFHEEWVTLARTSRWMIGATAAVAGISVACSALGFIPRWLLLFTLPLAPMLLLVLILAALPAVPISRRTRAIALLSVATIVSTIWTQWPLRLSFAAHRPSLERVAARIRGGEPETADRRIGLLRFRRITLLRDNVGFQLTGDRGGGHFFVQCRADSGFVWYNSCVIADLGNDWYLVHED